MVIGTTAGYRMKSMSIGETDRDFHTNEDPGYGIPFLIGDHVYQARLLLTIRLYQSSRIYPQHQDENALYQYLQLYLVGKCVKDHRWT